MLGQKLCLTTQDHAGVYLANVSHFKQTMLTCIYSSPDTCAGLQYLLPVSKPGRPSTGFKGKEQPQGFCASWCGSTSTFLAFGSIVFFAPSPYALFPLNRSAGWELTMMDLFHSLLCGSFLFGCLPPSCLTSSLGSNFSASECNLCLLC